MSYSHIANKQDFDNKNLVYLRYRERTINQPRERDGERLRFSPVALRSRGSQNLV